MKKHNTIGVSSSSTPEAWVAVSNNRQKIYGEKRDLIYLDDGQEFEIELYNPTTISYLAKIYLNGKSISLSGLVLKPGQRYFLDRFIDEKRKLVFSTYEVENTDEVKKAIESNGKIKVEFYPEQTPPLWYGGCTYTYYGGSIPTIGNNYYTTGGLSNSLNISGTNLVNTGSTTSYSSLTTGNSSYSSSTSSQSVNMSMAASLETGRVEKGGASDQSFVSENGSYSWMSSYTSEYQIFPRSVKPIEVDEIRAYCTSCGTRIKKKTWRFCPDCGNGLK
jgi:hypothetical protein